MKKNKLKKYIEILKENNLLLEENISEELKEKEIEIVTYDSRDVKQNTLFICKGAKFKIDYEIVEMNLPIFDPFSGELVHYIKVEDPE